MSDYVEYEEEGWFSRIADSIKGIGIGILLFMVAPCLLFWNEGRAVKRAQDLEAGKGAVVSVAADKVDKANEGKLVHVSGTVKVDETLADPEFKISSKGLALIRNVEMYQWKEIVKKSTKKKAGGKKVTKKKYKYEKEWSSTAINSDNFKSKKDRKKRVNPGSIPYEKKSFAAQNATLGAFTLSASIIGKATSKKQMTLTQAQVDAIPAAAKKGKKLMLHDGYLYLGKDPANPKVGDVRIKFEVAEPGVITVVSSQKGSSFVPFKGPNSTVELVSSGKKSSKDMFESAEAGNATMTWILRVVGFFLMFVGLGMIFAPLSVIADLIPFIGSVIGAMSTAVAFMIAAPLSLMTIAVAWIFYRPLLGIILFVVAGGFIGGLVFLVQKYRGSQSASAGAPPMGPPTGPPPM